MQGTEIEVLESELAEIDKIREGVKQQVAAAEVQDARLEVVSNAIRKEIKFLSENSEQQVELVLKEQETNYFLQP